jgi:importin subunit beta-1
MTILLQAASGTAQQSVVVDYDMVDYLLTLKESILEAFVGIVQGLKSAQKTYLINDQLMSIFQFMQFCTEDADRSEGVGRTVAGLLGDIAQAYPPGELRQIYQAPWVEKLIKELRQNRQHMAATRETARWAKEMIKLQA